MERDEEDNESVRDLFFVIVFYIKILLYSLSLDIIIHKNYNHDDASEIVWKRFE
jgi:hypothetical protein